MRSLCFIAFAILLTGVPYGQSLPTLLTLDAGDILQTAVYTFPNVVTKCYLEGPGGRRVEFKPEYNSKKNSFKFIKLPDTDVIQCRANVTNIDEGDTGLWTMTAEYVSGSVQSQSYSLTVNPPQGVSTEATPQEVGISYKDEQHFNSDIGNRLIVTIGDNVFYRNNNCSLVKPSGEQVELEKLNIPNIEIIESSEICSIAITVQTDEDIGNWTLVSDGRKFSEKHQIRLKFSIHVEETVNASASEVIVEEGNDLYVRLKNTIAAFDSCRLLSPNGNAYEKDKRYAESCGFIVRNIQRNDGGNWTIEYGNGILYRAPILVTVTAARSDKFSNVTWIRDRPVAEVVGAEDAVYCRAVGPDGVVYYDGFGRCQIFIDRALSKHEGVWSMSVGLPGRVLTVNSPFKVTLVEADSKPIVSTKVEANKPTVSLTCSVSSPHVISSCKFRHPSGRILMANEGVGEDRFSYHGASVGYQSDVHAHDCGLLINDPQEEDLGLWRCAMESEDDVYYGFLKVVCPWAMRDPEVAAAVVTEPTLNASRDAISSVAGDSVSMSCSVQSPISYCYFRTRNGTVFNVGPGNSHDQATYLGSGLDAGECGIRFPSLATADSGLWSCHVGFVDQKEPEQRSSFNVTVVDPMVVQQRMEQSQLIIEAQVYDNRQLDYCRFVRIDGFGFTTENMPNNYTNLSQTSQGKCGIAINNPTILEYHPWTVVVKIRGQDEEISRVTPVLFERPRVPPVVYYRMPTTWIVVMILALTLLSIAALLSTKNNRQWTYDRANAVRHSFMRKNIQQNPEKNTAMAA